MTSRTILRKKFSDYPTRSNLLMRRGAKLLVPGETSPAYVTKAELVDEREAVIISEPGGFFFPENHSLIVEQALFPLSLQGDSSGFEVH